MRIRSPADDDAIDERRRALMLAGLAAPALASLGRASPLSAAADPLRDTVVVNALGSLFSPHYRPGAGDAPMQTIVETRPGMVDDVSIGDAKKSGLSAVVITLGHVSGPAEPFEHTVAEIGRWDALLRARPDDLVKVLRVVDIEQAKPQGKVGVVYGFQNSTMLGGNAARVDIFADLGVRVFQLTYNSANAVGDGCMAPENRPLTPFGREVVERLNARRAMVDLSHSGERTCLDAIAMSTAPVVISHTGCRALGDSPRNKTDAELKALADKGGFVGVYFMPLLTPGRQSMAEDVSKHIEHAVKICGEDHVGIGTDGASTPIDMRVMRKMQREYVELRRKQGIAAEGESPDILFLVPDLHGVDQFRTLADLLRQRGHSSRRIEKILGGNYVRVARDIWGA